MIATPSPAISPSPADPPAAGPPNLLDQVRAAARSRRYGAPTEEIFVGWIQRGVAARGRPALAVLARLGFLTRRRQCLRTVAWLQHVEQNEDEECSAKACREPHCRSWC